ncbi:hypothetical protein [Antribacter gilvus]|uniref:hypothetical protein n=1 Tax=Antribacter gilvus TaxID=2304675 RepID=UPI000F794909|nr:hypothetical protein [Antribacter gilvus]
MSITRTAPATPSRDRTLSAVPDDGDSTTADRTEDVRATWRYKGLKGQAAFDAWYAAHEPPPLPAEDREAIARLLTPHRSRPSRAA